MKKRYFQSIRAKIFILFLSVVVAGWIGFWLAFYIKKTGDYLYGISIPILKCANHATKALHEGIDIVEATFIDNIEPSQFDDIRKYNGQFKKSAIIFQMYIQALMVGSESEAFKQAGGGLIYAMWEKTGQKGKLIIEQPPIVIQMLSEEASEAYNVFAETALQLLIYQKRIKRLTFLRELETAKNEQKKVFFLLQAVKKQSAKVNVILNAVNAEVDAYFTTMVTSIQKKQQQLIQGFFLFGFLGFVGVIILISFLTKRFLMNPLKTLNEGILAIESGDLDKTIVIKNQDELGELASSFNHMAKTLRETQIQLLHAQKMESLGKLAGGIAHDFNNLLGGILGFADTLQEEFKNNPKAHHSLQNIIRSAERAALLVQKLLGIARKGQYEKNILNMNALLLEAQEIMYRTIDKTITIKTDLAQNLWNIEGDANQMIQVFMNLGINARDAMPSGGEIWFETQNIEADETYCKVHKHLIPGRYVRISVLDTGAGISKDQLDEIFDPYFTTKEIGKGTGLGLAMVYGIIQNHKGHITVYSEAGKGTVFHLYFPAFLNAVGIQTKKSLLKETTSESVDDYLGKTILVVDDEEIMRELVQEILLDSGVTLHFATNGEEALTVYQQHRQEIDLIILDVIMPKMDGFKTFQQLRKNNPNLKIIFSSGYAENDTIRSLRATGNLGFIQKPYIKASLISCIHAVLVDT